MDPASGDAHLSPESKTEAVSEARRRVVEHACGVDALLKVLGRVRVLGHDALSVRAPVLMDVRDSRVHVGHDLHEARQVTVLDSHGVGRVGSGKQAELDSPWARLELDASLPQSPKDRLGAGVHCRLVEEDGLGCVARRRVVGLRVDGDRDRLRAIRFRVNVQVADPVGMTEHRDAGVLLHVVYESLPTAGDHEVDQRIELEQLRYFVSAGHEPNYSAANAAATGSVDRVHHDAVQRGVRMLGLAPALEEQPVARAQRQRCNLRQRIGAALEHHQQDANRDRDLRQVQPIRELGTTEDLPDRLVHRRELLDPCRQCFDLGLRHLKPLNQRGLNFVGLDRGEVEGICMHDLGSVVTEGLRNRLHYSAPLLGRQRLQFARLAPGRLSLRCA
mmetsp:Transcript_45625/g.126145  ORF Transcript_45625/g.126145 Transcript_45625/m.126145 type:complete len:389 (-) Transcript_45625:1916-3082(-)